MLRDEEDLIVWETKQAVIADEVRGLYTPLLPGQALRFCESGNDVDGFMGFYDNGRTKDGRLTVELGTYSAGDPDLSGKEARVVRHLRWDELHPYNRFIDKFTDWNRADFDPAWVPPDPYQADPQFEWYEVECEGTRLYAGRWHATEEDKRHTAEMQRLADELAVAKG